jgi:hypothetical protein
MKTFWIVFLCLVGHLLAGDFKDEIEKLGACKGVVLEGNILGDPVAGPDEAVTFHTNDPSQIKPTVNWIKAIPSVERPTRYYGTQPTMSTPEVLVFRLTFENGVQHQVAIYGKRTIVVDNDLSYRVVKDLDFKPLLSVIKNRMDK